MSASMSEFLHQFHFLRPDWLWGLLLLPVLLWLVKRLALTGNGWSQLIAPALLPQLLQGRADKRFPALPLLAAGWCLALLAMAGPSWQKQSQPLYQLQHARVMILDMSLSQYATDLKPNRLTRMRFKAMDLLERWPDGEVGLVAFSGEPFTISPLTDDRANLKNLIPSLSPEIMPTRGSRPDKAVESALALLESAGYLRGKLLLLTDGISDSQAEKILQLVADRDVQIHLLAVGTAQAAPIKLPDSSLLKDDKGAIILPQLDTNPMRRITRQTGGRFATLSSTDSDLATLIGGTAITDLGDGKQQDSRSERWLDSGYLLVLLLLPICLMAFRKGVLLVFASVLLLPPASEASEPPSSKQSLWQSLWQNSDQRGHQAFEQHDYQGASELFSDPNWRGASAYRNGDYEQALEHYSQGDRAHDWYNRGNALAQLARYQEAIDAYQQALDRDPELAPAKKNKQLLEQMQQQQSQDNQQSEDNQSSQDQSGEQPSSDDPSSSEQDGQSESDQGQNQQQPPQQDQASGSEQSEQPEQSPEAQGSQANADQQPEPRVPETDGLQQPADQQQQTAPEQFSDAPTQPEGSEQAADETTTAQAQRTADKLEQERQQQLQRWLEQVPDDPSLLLRNKMRLEYERRRQQGELDREVQQW